MSSEPPGRRARWKSVDRTLSNFLFVEPKPAMTPITEWSDIFRPPAVRACYHRADQYVPFAMIRGAGATAQTQRTRSERNRSQETAGVRGAKPSQYRRKARRTLEFPNQRPGASPNQPRGPLRPGVRNQEEAVRDSSDSGALRHGNDLAGRRTPAATGPTAQQKQVTGGELNGGRARIAVGEDMLVEDLVELGHGDAKRRRGFRFVVQFLGRAFQSRHRGRIQSS